MVQQNVAPMGAIVPEKIDSAGLWALDVDDNIWQDIGLEDTADSIPPPWLSNEKVRAGIRNLLDYDHCIEEEARLRQERRSLQELAQAEWDVLHKTMASNGELAILFLFHYGH